MMPPEEGPPMDRRWNRLSRRQFVVGAAGLGLLAGGGRLPGQAAQPPRVPRLGFLSGAPQPIYEAFREGLADLGYIEGQSIVIEWRFTESNRERQAEFAADLVRQSVDVIVAGGEPTALAAR